MTYISVKCPRCGCENVSKNGKTSYGNQQYICNNINCSKSSFILDFSYNASKPEVKSKIIIMVMNSSAIRDISRILNISPNTIINNLKKQLKFVNTGLLNNIQKCSKSTVDIIKDRTIGLDEMWSYVKNKSKQKWLWYAVDHNIGQIFVYAFRKRKDYVFLRLRKLLKHFNIEMNYTDDWESYKKYIDKNKHEVRKSNHQKIERKNLNLRTRIKRLTRKTICYSKTEQMYDIVIGLFINISKFGLVI